MQERWKVEIRIFPNHSYFGLIDFARPLQMTSAGVSLSPVSMIDLVAIALQIPRHYTAEKSEARALYVR